MNKKYVLDFSSWLAENKSVSGFRLNEAEESGAETGKNGTLHSYALWYYGLLKPENLSEFIKGLKAEDFFKMNQTAQTQILNILIKSVGNNVKTSGDAVISKDFEVRIGDNDVFKAYENSSQWSTGHVIICDNKSKLIRASLAKDLNKYKDSDDIRALNMKVSQNLYKTFGECLEDYTNSTVSIDSIAKAIETNKNSEFVTKITKTIEDWCKGQESKKGQLLPTPELLASVPVLKTAAENLAKKSPSSK